MRKSTFTAAERLSIVGEQSSGKNIEQPIQFEEKNRLLYYKAVAV